MLRGQNHSFISVLITTVTAFSLFIFIQTAVAITSYVSNETLSPIFEVNTRTEIPFNSSALVNSTLTEFGSDCPPRVAIYVHGWNRDDGEAKEEFNRIQTSLGHDNYKIPLVGFSWDSKVNWEAAKINAPILNILLASIISVLVRIYAYFLTRWVQQLLKLP